MSLTFAGFPAFFIHISMNLPDVAEHVISIVSNCIVRGKVGIGWSYWTDQQILCPGADAELLGRIQRDGYKKHFGVETNYNAQRQLLSARTALQRLANIKLGTPIIANLPGFGVFGLGIVTSTYNPNDNPLSMKDGGFFRTVDVSWSLVAPFLDGRPQCVEVNWKQIHTTYIPSATITHMPPDVYEEMVKLIAAKYHH